MIAEIKIVQATRSPVENLYKQILYIGADTFREINSLQWGMAVHPEK